MKKLVFTLAPVCAVLALATLGNAQTSSNSDPATQSPTFAQSGAHEAGGKRMQATNAILEKLHLTPSQKAKVSQLEMNAKVQAKSLRKEIKSGALDKTAVREKVKSLMKTFHENLLSVLTPSQRVLFKAEMKAEMAKMKKTAAAKAGASPVPPSL